MSVAKTKPVTAQTLDNGSTVYNFRCPRPDGCGADQTDPNSRFESLGWADEQHARDRGNQHLDEHESGEPMQTLADFEIERGLRDPEPAPFNRDEIDL